jgi:DNA-binding transcriptional regulator YdaS (Cro superfamily)
VHIVAPGGEQGERPPCTKLLTRNVHQAHIPCMTDAKTKLDLWMGDARDDVWLAGVVGCTRSQASRIRRGKSLPSLAGAVAIEQATKGKVRAADLVAAALPANDTDRQEQAA